VIFACIFVAAAYVFAQRFPTNNVSQEYAIKIASPLWPGMTQQQVEEILDKNNGLHGAGSVGSPVTGWTRFYVLSNDCLLDLEFVPRGIADPRERGTNFVLKAAFIRQRTGETVTSIKLANAPGSEAAEERPNYPAGLLGEDHAKYPEGFIEATRLFTNAPTSNRLDEAAGLMRRLPKVPILKVTYPEGVTNFAGHGSRFVTRDLEKPSFLLPQSEVLRLMGAPTFTNTIGSDFQYIIGSRPELRYDTRLIVEFHESYVVGSKMVSWPWSATNH
jgi:hypothetical protein